MNIRSLQIFAFGALLSVCGVLAAQNGPEPPEAPNPGAVQPSASSEPAAATEAPASEGPALSDTQQAIKVRFDRFEDTLFKMARYLQKTEPARAELVLRALGRSKEERVAERMTLISRMLSKEESGSPQYADAIEEQDAILANIRELLTILRSEDILDENRKEQERLKELARQVSALIDAEKVHQADTQRGTPTDRVAKAQERTSKRTGEIIQSVDKHDQAGQEKADGAPPRDGESDPQKPDAGSKTPDGSAPEGEQSDQKNATPKDGDPKDGDPKDGDPKDGDPKDGNPKDGNPKDGNSDSKPSDNKSGQPSPSDSSKSSKGSDSQSKPNDAPPQKGQPGSQSKPQDGQQSQQNQQGQSQESSESQQNAEPSPSTPGRQELEEARQRMEQAIQELEQKNRENASKEQEAAIRKLIEAKEQIEELLRQLREEERELLLRSLEARFQKMLQLQEAVLATTERLTGIPNAKWSDREFSQCRDAASTEREILIEADKSLEVLRADGSSVAFPEAVEQIAGDVGEVASRLGREDAGQLTVAIEQDVIAALKEMIQAFQKEMEKLRQQKSQQGGQQGSPSDPGLVDKLAELKMLKTLQLRINRRTKTLGGLIAGEQATEPDVVRQLRELAERQSRLQRATYDLATGKTAN